MLRYFSDHYKLEYVIDLERFEALQDAIAEVTGTALVAVDLRGNRITKHSACTEFCSYIRDHKELSVSCMRCDARAGVESARLGAPFIYMCHMDLIDMAIPIIVEGVYIGALMAGQVQLANAHGSEEVEHIAPRLFKQKIRQSKKLEKLKAKLPTYDIDKIRGIANLIHQVVNYIASEATTKLRFASLIANDSTPQRLGDVPGLADLQNTLNNTNALITTPNFSDLLSSSAINKIDQVLYPALVYINEKYNTKISLDEIAKLCNISPAYFSRLFKKEVGMNFNAFLSLVRLHIGKKLLLETSMKIHEVADASGFENPSYFARLFKRHYGKTPSEFRKDST